MNDKLTIALVQQFVGPDINENLERGVTAFNRAADNGADLVVFPELAFTPFYPQLPATADPGELAETIPGKTSNLFSEMAKKRECAVVINLFEKRAGKTYDSSPVIDVDGSILGITRMVHVLEAPCYHEQGYYTPGSGSQMVFATRWGRIGVAICYDRHYPEYMRRLAQLGADLVVVPQAGSVDEWPEGLFEAEMRVASFQNGFFSVLCNRVGEEECLTFEGKSFVTAPDGRVLSQAPALKEYILMAELDLGELKQCHARRHFLIDRRPQLYADWFGNPDDEKKV